ncbi:hypothetical protein HGRIS_014684 [Hohenbuehelia grisea]|uniref:Uncharacterized protein n=1 Tax=Hohenbuehelia grisea TaxID=104357 RepID=A0ABR3JW74_9AGAR
MSRNPLMTPTRSGSKSPLFTETGTPATDDNLVSDTEIAVPHDSVPRQQHSEGVAGQDTASRRYSEGDRSIAVESEIENSVPRLASGDEGSEKAKEGAINPAHESQELAADEDGVLHPANNWDLDYEDLLGVVHQLRALLAQLAERPRCAHASPAPAARQ